MDMTPHEIEASLEVPEGIAEPATAHVLKQGMARGAWEDARAARQQEAPWPAEENPVLRFLLWRANASIEAGMEPGTAMLQLAVHAWFEGGVENYDRGQRDARRLRSV